MIVKCVDRPASMRNGPNVFGGDFPIWSVIHSFQCCSGYRGTGSHVDSEISSYSRKDNAHSSATIIIAYVRLRYIEHAQSVQPLRLSPSLHRTSMNSIEIIHETIPESSEQPVLLGVSDLILFFLERDNGWEMTPDQIKCKKKDASAHPFHIYRVQNVGQLDKIPKVPGTVIIFEEVRAIRYFNDESVLCFWDGNSGRNQRWGKRILRWDGADFKWVSASDASVRIRRLGWEAVNQLRGADVVDAIISEKGLTKPRSKQREFYGLVDNLRATVEEKEEALARTMEALNKMTEENHVLRAQLQAIIGTSSHVPHPSHRLPSSLASASPDGPTICFGDRLYVPLCDNSDQPLSSDEPTLGYFQYSQLRPHSRGDEENWNMDRFSEHPAILPTSSTVS